MSWSFLTRLLEELSNHSAFVGKLWLTLLIVFRIVLTVVGAETIYKDEESEFICNTTQPSCKNVCYDAFAPLTHVRFWVFQTIVITTPTILYLAFAMHKIARMEDDDYRPRGRRKRMPLVNRSANQNCEEAEDSGKEDSMITEEIEPENDKEKEKKDERKKHDGWRRIKRDGLMKAYVLQLLSRVALEVAFLSGQCLLYGFVVAPSYVCSRSPCPHTVDCFVSRPTEKTVFLIIMYAASSLCLLLTVLEISQLGISGVRDVFQSRARCRHQQHQASQTASVYPCFIPSGNPGARAECSLHDLGRESQGDEASSRELGHLRRHLNLAQQHLEQGYQDEEETRL
ncbi:gap junction gamma-1 protein-like [Neoarius graeffei]|uniref:gap junction gamma-1 protein-like n=1 Tax=Neoarius graeffei TaxID=443677 RepID=UPI00298CD48B|nr:gap junction gamma-1 protein-like [Neoarius graeffei]